MHRQHLPLELWERNALRDSAETETALAWRCAALEAERLARHACFLLCVGLTRAARPLCPPDRLPRLEHRIHALFAE